MLCFTLYLRAVFQVQAPWGLIFGGAICRRVFCVTSLGGLHLGGGAYTWKGLFGEFWRSHPTYHVNVIKMRDYLDRLDPPPKQVT